MLPFCEIPVSSPRPKIIRIPFEPKTIGEHIRKKRLERELLQSDVAKLIGVSTDCITYWENNRSYPQIQFMPAIIKFLGFFPLAIDDSSLGGQILTFRNENGLSHKKLGNILGVDASTVSDWEKRRRFPNDNMFKEIDRLIGIL